MALGCETTIDQPLFAAGHAFEARLDLSVDLVIEAGDRGEDGRLEHVAVLHQLERISLVVTLASSCNQDRDKHELIENVRCGQVVNNDIILGKLVLVHEKEG